MSSEKRKIAYIDGKPYEIGPNHSSILKFVKLHDFLSTLDLC